MTDDAPTLTVESYRRWLRAQRPDMRLFLGLSELEQETLAILGDEYVLGMADTAARDVPAEVEPAPEPPLSFSGFQNRGQPRRGRTLFGRPMEAEA